MHATNALNPTDDQIKRTRNAIRDTWRREERNKRRRRAEARQQWLFSVLTTQGATNRARVA